MYSYIFQGMYTVAVLSMFLTKKTKPQLIIFSSAAIVNVLLNFYFIPLWGMFGAAFTTLVSYAIIPIVTFLYSRKLYEVNYEYSKMNKLLVISSIIILVSFQKEYISFLNHHLINICLIISFPVILYIAGFLDDREKQKLAEIFAKTRKKFCK